MSEFYHVLADYYDEIFPLNRGAVAFALSFLKNDPGAVHILDIGCATGQFPVALAKAGAGYRITAIEPDEKMCAIAKQRVEKEGADAQIFQAGMLDIPMLFPGNSFDMILCLGNTLVHLNNPGEIRRFVDYVFQALKKDGVFIMQIVNYSRILTQKESELPSIDTPNVTFVRKYEYRGEEDDYKIRFITRLTLKKSSEIIQNELFLYPLQFDQIRVIFQDAGFETVMACGSYNRDPWTPSSPALIMLFKLPV